MIVLYIEVMQVVSRHFADILDANTSKSRIIGRWSSDEQNLFIKGIFLYGNDWRSITSLINTRTMAQVTKFLYGEV